jgi:UbiD family decarboxylase
MHVYSDLRSFLACCEEHGELLHLTGAHWDKEMGAITELNARLDNCKALLFDEVPDHDKGYRVLVNATSSPQRLAMTLGFEANTTEELTAKLRGGWFSKLEASSPRFNPVEVTDGPVMENVQRGADVNLWKIPSPLWHELDGGRYIGTGNTVITRDPDTGWVNLGAYRLMLTDKPNETTLWMATLRHGRMHMNKYFERGERMPVVVTLGQDPLLAVLAGIETKAGVGELNVAGAIRGEPVKVIRGPITGLPIPADAEIVLEGWVRQGYEKYEGPFGEGTGYYAGGQNMVPVIEVEAVYHRTNPILYGSPPGKPPNDFSYYYSVVRSALIQDQMEAAGIPGVRQVWADEVGIARLLLVVSIKQGYYGHSRQAGLLASQVQAGAYLGRYVIVVDDDIDPKDLKEVMWAVITRAEPSEDIEIIRKAWGSKIDPLHIAYPKGTTYSSRAIIDACIPFEHIKEFPPVASCSPEYMRQVKEKWEQVLRK